LTSANRLKPSLANSAIDPGAPAAFGDFHEDHVQAHQVRKRDADVVTLEYRAVVTEYVDERAAMSRCISSRPAG
jgi:hypothetical protein